MTQGLLPSLWLLWHHQYWILTETGYPCAKGVLRLWISGTGSFTSPNHLEMVQILRGPTESPGSGPVTAESGLLSLNHQGEHSCLAQIRPPNAAIGRRQRQLSALLLSHLWGWLIHAFNIRASSIVLSRQGAGPAL